MYKSEEEIITHAKSLIAQKAISADQLWHEYASLIERYELLFRDAQFLTKISDRLQNKMNQTNQDLRQQKKSLQEAQDIILEQNTALQASKITLENKVQERTEQLNMAYNEMVAVNQELDTFVYRASHDLKGPISRLIGLSNLGMIEASEDQALQYFSMISNTAISLSNILNRLLSVNTIKRATVKKEPTLVYKTIQSAIQFIAELSGFDTVQLHISCNPSLVLMTDKQIFELLIQNMVELSIKTALTVNQSTQAVTIYVNHTAADKMVLVFSYASPMIPQENFEQVFDMFYRTTNHEEISGIELYIAKLAAEKLGGQIALLSSTTLATSVRIVL